MRFTGNGISHKNFQELFADFHKDIKGAFHPKGVVMDSDSEPEHDGDVEMEGEDTPMHVDNENYSSESTGSDEDGQKDLGDLEEKTDDDNI